MREVTVLSSVRQDLLGGHAAEAPVRMPRHNAVTGAAFVWEQERFDPVTRRIFCYISLRDPASRQVPRQATLHSTEWITQTCGKVTHVSSR